MSVTSRGNERRKVFFSKSDYEKFKTYLKDSHEKVGYLLHGYVLMSNHCHLLVEIPNANLHVKWPGMTLIILERTHTAKEVNA